ncbi:hypothetical protein LU699_05140 [Luteimonas fraxinea]|uniref:Uncharacterized protein n=1 Tax=Luteimonas fraxinea TaxID=2901869 RepID=A0ABS8UAB7_9GAMM|nr:hypothetical protein [Luteimonas fraxinea]MCD9095704.1 hypothetical protein [Luteimonas fraxinea]UHH11107.1 hypothetical protein LU699_05140 [Luteimonas fraxinea]
MATSRPQDRSTRLWRWGIGIGVVIVLLGVWWLALDRVAARIGLDAENTMRELPRNEDNRLLAD